MVSAGQTCVKSCSDDGQTIPLRYVMPEIDLKTLDIRLVGGNSSLEGRVEVRFQNVWGTICDDDWGVVDASVVCRELGFLRASEAPTGAHFGQGKCALNSRRHSQF